MRAKSLIAGVSGATSATAIVLVAVMLLPGLFPAVQAENISIDVEKDLPYEDSWDIDKGVTLSLVNVSQETILLATFKVQTIPADSNFGDYGRIDDYISLFVIPLTLDRDISFHANAGMTLRLDMEIQIQ